MYSIPQKTEPTVLPRFNKLFIALRHYLLGMLVANSKYGGPLRAFNSAANIHTGLRKDGNTTEFQHQLQIALLVVPLLPHLKHPAETLTAIAFHDTPADYPEHTSAMIEAEYGSLVGSAVERLNKNYQDGRRKSKEHYYEEMSNCPIVSIDKSADRAHNMYSMPGVISLQKQYENARDTRKYILPMLKKAKRNFPEQTQAYESLKFVLETQCAMTEQMLQLIKFEPSPA